MTIGPMLTMAMMSMSMGYTSLTGVVNGTTEISTAMPTLVMSGAMLATMLLWPTIQRIYQKKQREKKEIERKTKYSEYLNSKKEKFNQK